ncbi:uncharacterized protein LOC105187492 isoform X2 [Harpegnathos saltator]|nr:uncharacterized protein LOC105187492 isoform X2 [Harpegnathos saltator]XP_019698887.1 uncharacterized protein LOC105187492 isoform X2 [Harpegnathos saltator]XP_019698888.1 uncharacterized protein LOC105187492 isoform X2 [Harpegnathos saltator]
MAYILSKTPVLYRTTYYRNIILSPVAKHICIKNSRYFSSIKSDRLTEKRFKLKDNISDDYKLIYREYNRIPQLISITYYTGWFGVCFVIYIVGYIIIKNPLVSDKEVETSFSKEKLSTETDRIFMIISGMFLSIVLILGSQMFPFRIYHNCSQKLYKAIFVSNILGKKQIEIFGEGTIIPMFKDFEHLSDIFFKINDRIVLLDKRCFQKPVLYEMMIRKVK